MNGKPSADVLAAYLPGEAVLLNLETKDYHRLNETGAFLWRRLEAGASSVQMVAALCQNFLVDRAEASRSVDSFLDELARRRLLRDEPSTAE